MPSERAKAIWQEAREAWHSVEPRAQITSGFTLGNHEAAAAVIDKHLATPPPASADALGEVERVARALAKSNHEDPDAPLTKLADSDITHAWQLYIDDATAALSAMSQAGWIVGNADGTQWRTWEDGLPLWTGNIDHACRYARRIDAESAHQEDEGAWRIVPYTKGPRHD